MRNVSRTRSSMCCQALWVRRNADFLRRQRLSRITEISALIRGHDGECPVCSAAAAVAGDTGGPAACRAFYRHPGDCVATIKETPLRAILRPAGAHYFFLPSSYPDLGGGK